MFDCLLDYTTEVNLPVEQVWEYDINLDNWYGPNSKLEAYHLTGEIKSGTVVEVKVKGHRRFHPVLFQEVIKYEKITIVAEAYFSKAIISNFYEAIDSKRTRIVTKSVITSWLMPFVKNKLKQEIYEAHLAYLDRLRNLEK